MVVVLGPATSFAQESATPRGSRNVEVVGHLALPGLTPGAAEANAAGWRTADLELDQERPYAYVSRRYGAAGFDIVDLSDPGSPSVVASWTLPGTVGADDIGAQDVAYYRMAEQTYLVQAFQFGPESPNASLAAIVFDVSEAASPREVARLQHAGGFQNLFTYLHSAGIPLLLATGGAEALIFDASQFMEGEMAPIITLDTPEQLERGATGYYDVLAAFHPDTQQDRFYGAGGGGYHVIDFTDLGDPTALTSVSSAAVRKGHTIAPTPDGRYLVTSAGYRTSPIRIFDLQAAFDGQVPMVRTAVGAWAADWQNFAERLEVRWPYVFVGALDDGFQMFNMRDPANPYTIGYYHTSDQPAGTLVDGDRQLNGAWGLDVRNSDGLIAVTDLNTGLWLLRVEGFENWDGRGWGVPNVSTAQPWTSIQPD